MKIRLKSKFVIGISLLTFFLTSHTAFAQSSAISEASLYFSPETKTVNTNQEFLTEVHVNTAGAKIGGVGAKIIYDPNFLSIEKIETIPVFPDYPAKTFDNLTGKATISGIVVNKDTLYTGNQVFAQIFWKAKKTGTTSITFDYQPNSTKDSNIAVLYGTGDILEKVNAVALTIEGANPADVLVPITTNTFTTTPKVSSSNPSFLSGTMVLNILIITGILLTQAYLWRKNKILEKKVEEIEKEEAGKKSDL